MPEFALSTTHLNTKKFTHCSLRTDLVLQKAGTRSCEGSEEYGQPILICSCAAVRTLVGGPMIQEHALMMLCRLLFFCRLIDWKQRVKGKDSNGLIVLYLWKKGRRILLLTEKEFSFVWWLLRSHWKWFPGIYSLTRFALPTPGWMWVQISSLCLWRRLPPYPCTRV